MKNLLNVVMLVFLLAVSAPAAVISTIWVLIEDQPYGRSDKDRNDHGFRVTGQDLTVLGSGTWNPMVMPNQDGNPFWDQSGSTDTPPGAWNGGNFMTGTGMFAGNPNSPAIPVSQLEYRGVGTSAETSFSFASSGIQSATLLVEVAAWAGQNQLYWYNVDSPNTLHLLFAGSAAAGAIANFSPSGEFAFLLDGPGGVFRTTSQGEQYALFRQTPIPEPSAYATMGVALIGLGFVFAKRRRAPQF